MTLATEQPAKRKIKPHIRPKARKLRTQENANLICRIIEDGGSLRDAASILSVAEGSITNWIREDTSNGGAEIGVQYARAIEIRAEHMATELLSIADDKGFMKHPMIASALVNQQRLAVDSRKWLLSKMLPRKYGDRIEVAGDASAPIVTRIELVAVEPPSRARIIDNVSDVDDDPQKP